jgi:hypothetical protein
MGVTVRKVVGSTPLNPVSAIAMNFMLLGSNGVVTSSLCRMISVPGAKPEKSMTTSERSAGAVLKVLSGSGPSIRPPSVPIRLKEITCPEAAGFSSLRS